MIVIIQARNSSKRLPYKTSYIFKNKTILDRVISSVKRSKKIKKIIVATSNLKKDDIIIKNCKKHNLNYYRGSHLNVAKRFYEILLNEKSKFFMRISADSPFLDYKLINKSINLINKNNHLNLDIVSNVFPRSFPKGQSIEIINRETYLKNYYLFKNKKFKEHVTLFFYQNAKKFKIINFKSKIKFNNVSLAVDEKKDLIKYKKIVNFSKDKYMNFEKILDKINEKN